MKLDSQTVERVSLLARLQLSADELKSMTEQMGHILEYVRQLDELDTSGVEPMAHAIDMCNVFAEDVHTPGLSREEALANAPNHDEECFRVPAVLG